MTIIDPGVKADSNYFMAKEGLRDNHFVKMPDGRVHVGEVWPGPSYFPDFYESFNTHVVGKACGGLEKGRRARLLNDMNEPACWGQAFPLESVFDDSGRILRTRRCTISMVCRWRAQRTRACAKPIRMSGPLFCTRQRVSPERSDMPLHGQGTMWRHGSIFELGIRMMLGMSLSGQPFVGTDIGGFIGTPTPELYARWIQVGAVSPLCRTHTHYNSPDQEPWSFGEEVEAISKKYISLRYELLPYLYTLFHSASETGEPVIRPLFYNDQNDPKCFDWAYQQQFFVGPDLLIAPVTKPGRNTSKGLSARRTMARLEYGESLLRQSEDHSGCAT